MMLRCPRPTTEQPVVDVWIQGIGHGCFGACRLQYCGARLLSVVLMLCHVICNHLFTVPSVRLEVEYDCAISLCGSGVCR